MEPITHFLTGAHGPRRINRRTAYAALAAVLAAEAADLDIVWAFAGPVEGLKHHRGITHTFIASPLHRCRRCWRHLLGSTTAGSNTAPRAARGKAASAIRTGRAPGAPQAEPVRWRWVYLAAFISALSHILLDWTK